MTLPARQTRTNVSRADPANEFDRITQQLSQLFEQQWSEVPSLMLPEAVDPDRVEATLDDGVLTVRVPTNTAGHRRHLEVK